MPISGTNSENQNMRVLVKELLVDGEPVSGGGGVAAEATALETPRNLSLTGDVAATLTGFDGTANVSAVAAIGAGVIVNADVNATAAIAATKISVAAVASTNFSFAGGTLLAFCHAIGDAIPAA